MDKQMRMVAKTFQGLEEVLAEEIRSIGGKNVKTTKRAVEFEGDQEVLYRANFYCRTALRILKVIDSFPIHQVDDLYNGVYNIDWNQFLNTRKTFMVNSTANNELFNNTMFVSLKVKDAVADFFRKRLGARPSVDTENPDVIINVHVSGNTCSVALDSSGESLHKRGYRTAQTEAPLNEALAAGLILLTGWDGSSDFIDPMCGSGTLSIEAALIAKGIPPGMFRDSFAFEKWRDFDRSLFLDISEDYNEKNMSCKIFTSDISLKSINIAKENIKSACLSKDLNPVIKDFGNFTPESDSAVIIMNPPYGERLNPDHLLDTYEMIGERLKHHCPNHTAWIISYSKECFDKIGLKSSQRLYLFNGALECQYREYEMYEGSKKNLN